MAGKCIFTPVKGIYILVIYNVKYNIEEENIVNTVIQKYSALTNLIHFNMSIISDMFPYIFLSLLNSFRSILSGTLLS